LEATFVGATLPTAGKTRGRRFPRLATDDDSDEDDDDDSGEMPVGTPPGASVSKVLEMLGLGAKPAQSDPRVEELVRAAVDNDAAAIEKLVAAGADLNASAPLKAPAGGASSLTTQMLTGNGIPFPVTPLLAALASRHTDAARKLIELGADVQSAHPVLGTPVHAAAMSGNPALLQLVLNAGGDGNALNTQRQTPLQALQYFRQMTGRLGALGPLGAALQGKMKAQWEKMMPDALGMDECEQILRERTSQK
jgi:hypothetical protein